MSAFALAMACVLAADTPPIVVEVEQPATPPPTGVEPLLTWQRGGFSGAFGGFLRVQAGPTSPPLTSASRDVISQIYTRGEVLPALRVRYMLELDLPRAFDSSLHLRQAWIAMRLAPTPLLGELHAGVVPLPVGLDGERRVVDRPLHRRTRADKLFGLGDLPGALYRLDLRGTVVPLRFDIGAFSAPTDDPGQRADAQLVRLEALLWGRPRALGGGGYRELSLGVSLSGTKGFGDQMAGHAWLKLRVQRLLLEAELAVAPLSDPSLTSAWQVVLGVDLLPELFTLLLAAADGREPAPPLFEADPREPRVWTIGAILGVVRQRLVLRLNVDLEDPARDLSDLDARTWFSLDMRF